VSRCDLRRKAEASQRAIVPLRPSHPTPLDVSSFATSGGSGRTATFLILLFFFTHVDGGAPTQEEKAEAWHRHQRRSCFQGGPRRSHMLWTPYITLQSSEAGIPRKGARISCLLGQAREAGEPPQISPFPALRPCSEAWRGDDDRLVSSSASWA
jgi:hypothetical protein